MLVDGLVGHGSGEPEVGDLDLAVVGEDDVLGLDVAVDQPAACAAASAIEDRLEDVERLARGERPLLAEDVTQRLPSDVLHGEVRTSPSSPWS